ncbi:unnamed protein product, partial [Wuchereria bancrofti]
MYMVRLAVIEEVNTFSMFVELQLELPSHLIRKNNINATKRSRSHPVYFPIHIDSDDESDNGSATVSHISRMSAYALFSGLRTPETASSTNDHSV